MLDTVILQIPLSRVNIRHPEYFGQKGKTIVDGTCLEPKEQAFIRYEADESIYRPRVTLLQNFGDQKLKIEFSVPKLLFGNNFEELEESDFWAVVDALDQRLQLWAISIDRYDLAEANVTGFHLGKNILFEDYTSASSMISLF